MPHQPPFYTGPIGTPLSHIARQMAEREQAEDRAVAEYESGLADADNYGADDPGSDAPTPKAPWEA